MFWWLCGVWCFSWLFLVYFGFVGLLMLFVGVFWLDLFWCICCLLFVLIDFVVLVLFNCLICLLALLVLLAGWCFRLRVCFRCTFDEIW